MEINSPDNKENVAIVCVGFNRINSIKRLLNSLLAADYPDKNVPLVLSIDCSNNEELYRFVKEFQWPFGDKYVNIQKERLGLKNHIFQCADLTRYFRAVVILEDDLFVSKNYYNYILQTLDKYSDRKEIAEIALYKNEINGYVGFPFSNLQTGSDVFLMQDVCTSGECFTEAMWSSFKEWNETHSEEDIMNVDMPDEIKGWTRAWSRFFNAYVVDQHKYVLYPNTAVSTNYGDVGEHDVDNRAYVQVTLQQDSFTYRLPDFKDLPKYDIYFNNEDIPSWLGIDSKEICLDCYGFGRTPENGEKYILSSRLLPLEKVADYAVNMRPMELNFRYNVEGSGIAVYKVGNLQIEYKKCPYNPNFLHYFLCVYTKNTLFSYIKNRAKQLIKRKLHRK